MNLWAELFSSAQKFFSASSSCNCTACQSCSFCLSMPIYMMACLPLKTQRFVLNVFVFQSAFALFETAAQLGHKHLRGAQFAFLFCSISLQALVAALASGQSPSFLQLRRQGCMTAMQLFSWQQQSIAN